jgi:hypothetical protein
MPSIQGNVGLQNLSSGAAGVTASVDRTGSLLASEAMGRYANLALAGKLFMAQAIVTAPVIYTTAAGTGGPLLWNNPSSGINAHIIGVSFGITVVTTVAAVLGLTWGTGQTSAPTTTTAIDGRSNMLVGGAASNCTPYRIGTVANAGASLLPFANLHTGALTVDSLGVGYVDIGGAVIVPPGGWASIAASATASTTVGTFGLIYAELPA